MKNKVIVVCILMLMITTAVLPASEIIENDENNYFNRIENSNLPDDFELIAYSVSTDTWETNYRLQINNDGLSKYYCMYPEDREELEWTLLNEFTIPSNSMDELWNEILDNDFFNLDDLYKSPITVLGGGYAKLTITGDGQTNTVKTENIVVPKFERIIIKINMITPGDSDLIYNALMIYESNSPPFKPDKPIGETSGESGGEYEYTTSCIDPEFNKVWYLFDWDDGTDSGWIGPYNSGEEASAKHTWSLRNLYGIKVKAKDECGAESIWSDPLPVSIPKIKQKDNTFLLRILEWLNLNGFQTGIHSLKSFISNYLLNEKTIKNLYQSQSIDEQTLWITNPTGNVATASFQNGGFTKVEIEGCNITVKLSIEIFGNGTEEQGGTVSAEDIKKSIEDFWNKNGEGQDWYIRCKEKDNTCVPEEPGCKVTFNVTVINSEENENLSSGNWSGTGYWKNNSSANGHHQIRIINNSGWRSVVYIWPPYNLNNFPPNNGTDPYSGNNNRLGGIWSSSASAKVYAHEAGHLMGLADQYQDVNGTSVPNAGYETNIMASVSKCNETANRSQIEEIVNNGGVYCPCECCPEENDTEDPEVNIETPQDGSTTSSPVNVKGTATDTGGSGIVELDFRFEWIDGFYNGQSSYYSPPEEWIGFILGPIYLEQFIEIGEWIKIIIYAKDGAGNTGSDEITIIYEGEEDNTPPITEKIVGEPNEDGGYIIWPFTPITLEATDDMSGVQYIYYEVWWDSNEDGIVDMLMAEKTVYNSIVMFSVDMYGILINTIELRWHAVDNANNVEEMHYQQHYVTGG